ncbi:MAG: hypothetical protein ACMVO3_07940 [Thalassobaculum sp.]
MLFHRDLEENLPGLPALRPSPAPRRATSGSQHAVRRRRIPTDRTADDAGSDPLQVPRPEAVYRPAAGRPRPRPDADDAIVVAHGKIDGRARRRRRIRFRLHGRVHGHRRSATGSWPAARLAVTQQAGADRRSRLGRRAHAGRHPVADADAAHDRSRSSEVKEAGLPYHRRSDRPDHGWRHRVLRHAGRHRTSPSRAR